MRINYFDYFRAIAILLIVAGHSYGTWVIDTIPEKTIATLITGGTALFVFISGFFFHHVFYPKFQYKSFLLNKAKYVLLPYVILSSLAFLLIVLIINRPDDPVVMNLRTIAGGFSQYLKHLWTGETMLAYWYIPFIMIVFALSPLFIIFIKMNRTMQISIFAAMTLVSMIAHRPLHNFSPLHSVLYFTPMYLLGIIFSINKHQVENYIKNKSLILGAATVMIAATQVLVANRRGNYEKSEIFSYAGIDIHIIQKLFMIFFLLSILMKIEEKDIKPLKFIASASFAIYFLHPWVLWISNRYREASHVNHLPEIIVFILNVILVLSISIGAAISLKSILGTHSRLITGW